MFTHYGTPVTMSPQRQRAALLAEIEEAQVTLERFHPESLEAANWRRYLDKLHLRQHELTTPPQ